MASRFALSALLLLLAWSPVAAQQSYSGRAEFQLWPKEKPAIDAVLAGPLAELRRYDFPPYALSLKPGQVVADIGCGRGKFSFLMAESVGADGKVYCRDVSENAISAIHAKVEEEDIKNIDAAVSAKDDVTLPADSIDIALLSDVYQFVIHQNASEKFVRSLFESMRDGGVVVVTNVTASMLYKDEEWQPYLETVVEEFTDGGFEPGQRYIIEDDDDRRPILVFEFRKPAAEDE